MSKALSINWISRLWETKQWNSIINEAIDKYGGIRFLLRCNYDYNQIKLPNFYKNVLRYSDEVLEKRTGHYIIWNNQDIKIGGCQIFYKEWVTKGIICIDDLCNNNDNFLSYEEFKQRTFFLK